MRSVTVAVVLVLALCAGAPAWAAKGSLEDADRLLLGGEFARAAAVYSDLAQAHDAPALVRLRLAAALLRREHHRDAIVFADAAVAAEPSSEAYALRSLVRFRAGRFRDAEADRDRALAGPSPSPLARFAEARLLASESRSAEALAAVDAALAGASFLDRVFRFDELSLRTEALDELDRQKEALAANEAVLAAAPPTNELLRQNVEAQVAFRRATLGLEITRVASGASEATLPLTLRNGALLVLASINGAEPALFLLDTGAGISILFPKYAKSVKFQARPERAWAGAVGGNGRVPIRYGLAGRVGLGGIAVENVPFAVIDWEIPQIAGIIGLPLLRPFLATVDYRAKQLRLRRASAASGDATGGIPFRLVGNAAFVETTVNERGPFNFELDTGASPELVPVDESVTDAVGLSRLAPNVRRARGAGAAGSQDAFLFPEATVSWGGLAPVKIGLVSQRISPSRPERRDGENGLVSDTELEGLIGFALLGGKAVTIDFVSRRLYVR